MTKKRRTRKKRKTSPISKRLKRGALLLLMTILLGSLSLTALFRVTLPPFSGIMISRQLSSSKPETGVRHKYVPLAHISCNLIRATLAAEDQRFLVHQGFDTRAIKQAIHHNLSGGRLRGGSTISQQTAKNLFLWPSRSWLRKGFEVYYTVLIEQLWSKSRILEVYLNIIEMGHNIYGAEAAAKAYFNKSAQGLSPAESALLAAILPAPLKRDPAHPSPYLKRKQAWILRQMTQMKATPLCSSPSGNPL